MTNYDRALRVLEDARRPGDLRIHPNDAVEALSNAGLLAADLPVPVGEAGGDAWWEPCGPGYVVTRYKEPITGRYLIGVDDSPYAVESQEAHELGLAILAAAKHKEEA